MKDPRIAALRSRAERDLAISDGSLRLFLRLLTFFGARNKAFYLDASQTCELCGLNDRKTAARRLQQLVSAGYLLRFGPDGCPPTNSYLWGNLR